MDQYGLDESSETQNKSGKYENLIGNYVDIGYLVQYYGELEEYDFYDSDGYGWVDRLDIDLGPGELKDRFGMCAFAKIKDIV